MRGVAPHAGAWIETFFAFGYELKAQVAPHAGAWIETYYCPWVINLSFGRPSCGGVD